VYWRRLNQSKNGFRKKEKRLIVTAWRERKLDLEFKERNEWDEQEHDSESEFTINAVVSNCLKYESNKQ